MRALTQEYLDRCPVENGFRLRGKEMTRIEVFIDAAFAFAVTLLVISFDEIPASYHEMVGALKGVPAFIIAVVQIVWIWHTHNIWSRRFGLEDAMTVVLSAALLIIVLVYIYPLRVMAGGMMDFFTRGYLASDFRLDSIDQLRFMFLFLGVGFAALCSVFTLLHSWALHRADQLRLSGSERYAARTLELAWLGSAVAGLLTIVLALSFPEKAVPYAGFGYFLLGIWNPWIAIRRERRRPVHLTGDGRSVAD